MKKLSQEESAKVLEDMKVKMEIPKAAVTQWKKNTALDMAIEALKHSEVPNSSDCISRQDAIDAIKTMSSAQPEIIRCKDCEYGEQDEVGRWFCRGLGCQIGNEDGSGYCADAERRTDG